MHNLVNVVTVHQGGTRRRQKVERCGEMVMDGGVGYFPVEHSESGQLGDMQWKCPEGSEIQS